MATQDYTATIQAILEKLQGGAVGVTDLQNLQPASEAFQGAATPQNLAMLEYLGIIPRTAQSNTSFGALGTAASGQDPLTAAASTALLGGMSDPRSLPSIPGLGHMPKTADGTPLAELLKGVMHNSIASGAGQSRRDLRDARASQGIGQGLYHALMGTVQRDETAQKAASDAKAELSAYQQGNANRASAMDEAQLAEGTNSGRIAAALQLANQLVGRNAGLVREPTSYSDLLAQTGSTVPGAAGGDGAAGGMNPIMQSILGLTGGGATGGANNRIYKPALGPESYTIGGQQIGADRINAFMTRALGAQGKMWGTMNPQYRQHLVERYLKDAGWDGRSSPLPHMPVARNAMGGLSFGAGVGGAGLSGGERDRSNRAVAAAEGGGLWQRPGMKTTNPNRPQTGPRQRTSTNRNTRATRASIDNAYRKALTRLDRRRIA